MNSCTAILVTMGDMLREIAASPDGKTLATAVEKGEGLDKAGRRGKDCTV